MSNDERRINSSRIRPPQPTINEIITNTTENAEDTYLECTNLENKYISISTKRLTTCLEYNNDIIVAGFDGTLYFYSKITENTNNYNVCNSIIRCLEIDNENNVLFIGNDKGELILFDLDSKCTIFREKTDSPIYCISRIGGSRIITGEKDGDVIEWHILKKGTKITQIHKLKRLIKSENVVFAIKEVENQSTLVITNSNGEKILFNLRTGRCEKLQISHSSIFSFLVTADSYIYGLSDGKIIVESFDGTTDELIGHTDVVRNLKISRNQKWLFSVSKDRTTRAWNRYTNNAYIISFAEDYVYDICISNDGMCAFIVDGTGILKIIKLEKPIDEYDAIALD